MAYVDQTLKAKISENVKKICKKYGVKATLSIRHHSTLCLNIKSGPIDFLGNFHKLYCERENGIGAEYRRENPNTTYLQANPYHYNKHFDGKALAFLQEVIPAMNDGNWDKSDIMTDYFNVGWYIDINIGKWDKPYLWTK